MSLRSIPVAAELLGLVSAGAPDPLMKWTEDGGRRVQTNTQETDDHTKDCPADCARHTGLPLFTCYFLPTVVERPEVIQVRVTARQQPVLTLFGPVAVDNLEVNVRVDKGGKLQQYWSASDVRDAGQQHRRNGQPEHKEGQPA